MLREDQLKYVLSLQDNASGAYTRFEKTVVTGDREMAESMAQTSRVMDDASLKTGKLTQFIQAERRGNRERAFLFRESSQAIGAMALALGVLSQAEGDEQRSLQKMTRSLTEGFLAFQGLNFALKGLGMSGPAAGAIAALSAIGIVMHSLNRDTEAEKKHLDELNKKILELQVSLGVRPSTALLDNFNKQLDELRKKADEIQKRTPGFMDYLDAVFSGKAGTGRGMRPGEIFRSNKTIEETENLENQLEVHKGIMDWFSKETQELKRQETVILSILQASIKMKPVVFIDTEQEKRMNEMFELQQKIQNFMKQTPQLRRELQEEAFRKSIETIPESMMAKPAPIAKIQVELSRLEKRLLELSDIGEQTGEILWNGFDIGVNRMVESLIMGTETMGEAFAAMTERMIAEWFAMLAKTALIKFFQTLLSLPTGGASVIPGTEVPGGGIMETRPGIGGGGVVNVNLSVNAIDSKDVAQWMAKVETRRLIIRAIRESERANRS